MYSEFQFFYHLKPGLPVFEFKGYIHRDSNESLDSFYARLKIIFYQYLKILSDDDSIRYVYSCPVYCYIDHRQAFLF